VTAGVGLGQRIHGMDLDKRARSARACPRRSLASGKHPSY